VQKKSAKQTEIKTTGDLRKVLLESIIEVRQGNMDSLAAASIATLARQVITSAKLDFDVRKHYEKDGTDAKQVIGIELSPASRCNKKRPVD